MMRGFLYDEAGRVKITEKFRRKIDGLKFLPHCNFGTEHPCARLAKGAERSGAIVMRWMSAR